MQTILPGKYLNGAQFRPRHIHFRVSGEGSPILTTPLYFEGDNSIPIDPRAFTDEAADRIIALVTDSEGHLTGFLISVWISVLEHVLCPFCQTNPIFNI